MTIPRDFRRFSNLKSTKYREIEIFEVAPSQARPEVMAAQGAEGEIREVGEGGVVGKIHTAEAFKARAAARPTQD